MTSTLPISPALGGQTFTGTTLTDVAGYVIENPGTGYVTTFRIVIPMEITAGLTTSGLKWDMTANGPTQIKCNRGILSNQFEFNAKSGQSNAAITGLLGDNYFFTIEGTIVWDGDGQDAQLRMAKAANNAGVVKTLGSGYMFFGNIEIPA